MNAAADAARGDGHRCRRHRDPATGSKEPDAGIRPRRGGDLPSRALPPSGPRPTSTAFDADTARHRGPHDPRLRAWSSWQVTSSIQPRRGHHDPRGAPAPALRSCATHRWWAAGITRSTASGRERDRVHAERPGCARTERDAGDTRSAAALELWGDRSSMGPWSPSVMRRLRYSTSSTCSIKGAPKPAAVLGLPGRIHRRGRVEARPGRIGLPVPGGARASGRQRAGRLGRQRDRQRGRVTGHVPESCTASDWARVTRNWSP